LRDVGSNSDASTPSETPTLLHPPLPLQRDVGGSSSLDGEVREGGTRGGTQ